MADTTFFYRQLFDRLSRWSLGLVFAWSGVTKLAQPAAFAAVISDFGLLPEPICPAAAVLLAGGEVLLAIALVTGIGRAREISVGLLVFFIMILAYGLYAGLDVDCGCFGSAQTGAPYQHGLKEALYRDFALLALAVFTVVINIHPRHGRGQPSMKVANNDHVCKGFHINPEVKTKAPERRNFPGQQLVSVNHSNSKEDRC